MDDRFLITEADIEQHFDRVVEASSHEVPVQLRIRGEPRIDSISASVLAASLARGQVPLKTEIVPRSETKGLLLTLLRMIAEQREPPVASANNVTVSLATSFERRGMFCISTSRVACRTPDDVRAAIGRGCSAADIVIRSDAMGLVTALAYEAVANAEEHGCVQLSDEPQFGLRFLAMQHHLTPGYSLSPGALKYISDYVETYRRPEGGWLEMVIADSGMGVSFPGYFVDQVGKGSSAKNLYVQPFGVESARLQKALAMGFTTKGTWGRLLTTQTRPGAGSHQIALYLEKIRGYASLRTGRAFAEWSFLPTDSNRAGGTFDVSQRGRPLFLGTVWQLIVPLTGQAELF